MLVGYKDVNNNNIWINLDLVTKVIPETGGGGSIVYFVDGTNIIVKTAAELISEHAVRR